MMPIRDAFDQIGRDRFHGEWTGQEILLFANWPTTGAMADFSADERSTFDRCTAVMAELTKELEAGRVVAVTTGVGLQQTDVPSDYWRDAARDGVWHDGAEKLAEYLTDIGTSRFIRFPAPETAKVFGRPGAPTKYQKPDLWRRFEARCKEVGFPSPDNEKGWQRQADVARWLAEQIEDLEGVRPDHRDNAVKSRAKEFMQRGSEI